MQQKSTKPEFLTTRDICQRLQVSRPWIYDQMKKGAFPRSIKLGNCTRWRSQDVEHYINTLGQGANNGN